MFIFRFLKFKSKFIIIKKSHPFINPIFSSMYFLLLKPSEKRKWLLRQKKYFIVYSAYYSQRNSSTWMWSRVYSSLCSVILSSLFSDVSFSVCWYIIFTFCLMLFQPWYSFVYFVANSPFIWFCKFPCFIICAGDWEGKLFFETFYVFGT